MGCKSCEKKRKKFQKELEKRNLQKGLKGERTRVKNGAKLIHEQGVVYPHCIFVTGLESSGTRYLAKIILDMGYAGESGNQQKYLNKIPNPERIDKLMIRMSQPHGEKWNIPEKIQEIKDKGYNVSVLYIVRDYVPCMLSSIKRHHINEEAQKRQQILKSFEVMSRIPEGVNVYPITYQGLGKTGVIKWLVQFFALPEPFKTQWKDGDMKWYDKYE